MGSVPAAFEAALTGSYLFGDLGGEVINSTTGRSEAAYLAIMVLLFAGVVVIGTGYLIIKWLPSLVESFRAEMAVERASHQLEMQQARELFEKQCELLRVEHKQDVQSFVDAMKAGARSS